MKNSWILLLLAIFVMGSLVALLPDSGEAIPAFAREYRMSCTTCHQPPPRLKAYGEDFAGNAFKLEDQDNPRQFHDTGDDILSLFRDFPIAVRFDTYFRYTDYDNKVETDMQVPYAVKFLTGGPVSDNIGYYFYFYMSERGEVAGVEDAYLHFNNLFDQEFDIMFGQFQVSDPLYKRELRLTYEDYEIYRTQVGETVTNLTYDRGIMMLYTAPFGTDAIVEIVNGNGIHEADGEHNFDNDDNKNILARLTHSVGPVRLGGMYYMCKAEQDEIENDHNYIGVDGTFDVGEKVQLNWQYILRTDDNPNFEPDPGDEIETEGAIAELVLAPQGANGRHFFVGLYNYVDSDLEGMKYSTISGSYSYLLRRNVRWLNEITYDIENEGMRAITGFTTAF